MKHQKIMFFLYLVFLTPFVYADSFSLETGFFKDQKGFVDSVTKQKVFDAQNLMGHRYIGIETNLKGSIVESVEVFDTDGNPIETGTPLNISEFSINGEEQATAILKLWLKAPEGTSFKLLYHFK
jgi:hypothetical protein